MSGYTIGQAGRWLELPADTIRYYERCGLLPPIPRSPNGTRRFGEDDLARIRFIRRAQKMDFRLAEVGELLAMREDPAHACDQVRKLTRRKLGEVEERLRDLARLREELDGLIRACEAREGDRCPILEGIDPEE